MRLWEVRGQEGFAMAVSLVWAADEQAAIKLANEAFAMRAVGVTKSRPYWNVPYDMARLISHTPPAAEYIVFETQWETG
jgi:hypothetical protein